VAEAKVYNTNNELAEADLAKVFVYTSAQTEHQYTMQKLGTGHYLLDTKLDLYPQQYKLDMVFFHNSPYDTISYSDVLTIQEGSAVDVNILQATLGDIWKFLNMSNFSLSSLFYNASELNTSNQTAETVDRPESQLDKNKLLLALMGFFVGATALVAYLDKKVRR
jgi:hypothetical protein